MRRMTSNNTYSNPNVMVTTCDGNNKKGIFDIEKSNGTTTEKMLNTISSFQTMSNQIELTQDSPLLV